MIPHTCLSLIYLRMIISVFIHANGIILFLLMTEYSQVVLVVKNLCGNAGDIGDTSLVSGSGRSPVGRLGNALQYSCLENPIDRSLVGCCP